MLYIASPISLEAYFPNSTWLVYDSMIQDVTFQDQDSLILMQWVVPEPWTCRDVIHRARERGARVIYVGNQDSETKDWKTQLVYAGVYDFCFFDEHEIDIAAIQYLLEHPRTARDVREYFAFEPIPLQNEPTFVEITTNKDTEKPKQPQRENAEKNKQEAARKPRFSWSHRERREKQPIIHVLPAKLLVVVGLIPRVGVSTIAYLWAKQLASQLPAHTVRCVEFPGQWPRMWEYFQCHRWMAVDDYIHWSKDSVGQGFDVDGVHLVPLPKDSVTMDTMEPFFRYQYRQAYPVTVVDSGEFSIHKDALYSLADQIVCVLDCDPTYLPIQELGDRYRQIMERYGDRVVPVLNKRTKAVHFQDVFEEAISVPYFDPNRMQESLWNGSFISVDKEQLRDFIDRTVLPVIPNSFRKA